MKRLLLTFTVLGMLMALLLAACTPGEVADVISPTDTADTADTTETGSLPPLPALDGYDTAGGRGGGGGGGGGIGLESSNAYGGDGDVVQTDMMPIDWEPINVFSGTQFVANVTFPAELGPSMVLEQRPWTMDVETARQIADRWGFNGPLYLIPQPAPVEGETTFVMPPTYFVFDGTRTLQLDAQFIYLYDSAAVYDQNNLPAFDQSKAIAENFLQTRGLLDFQYEIRQGYQTNEVNFYRLVDGRPVNQPEIWVSVLGDQVANLSYTVLSSPAQLGNYPLISAEAAWQKLIEQATVAGEILFEVMPADMGVVSEPPVVEPAPGQPAFWMHTYQPGEEAHLYTWPSIYVAAAGDAVPHIETYPLKLQTNDDTLRAIGAAGSRMFHFWGTVGADGKTLELAGYETLDETTYQSLFIEGTTSHLDGQLVVTAFTGESYIVPNAPADVPDGLEVSVYAYASRDAGLAHPILEWDNISERYVYEEQPVEVLPVEGETAPGESVIIDDRMMWQPYIYQNVTVDKVELAYYYSYVYDEAAMERGEYSPATILLQPVWKFSGTAENGDQMTFYIQAVASDLIEASN